MTNPRIYARLLRVARILDRAKRWEKLSFMDDQEADRFLLEYELRNPDEDEDEDEEASMDDGSYPAGPRAEPNNSRYKVEPGHGQDLSSLLRSTAASRALLDIGAIVNKKHHD